MVPAVIFSNEESLKKSEREREREREDIVHEVYVILPSRPSFPLSEVDCEKQKRKTHPPPSEKIPLQTSFPLTNRVSPSPVELSEQFYSDLHEWC